MKKMSRSLEEIIEELRNGVVNDTTDWKKLHMDSSELFFALVKKGYSGEEISFIGHMISRMGDGLMTGGMVMKFLVEQGVIKKGEGEEPVADTERSYG